MEPVNARSNCIVCIWVAQYLRNVACSVLCCFIVTFVPSYVSFECIRYDEWSVMYPNFQPCNIVSKFSVCFVSTSTYQCC